MIRQGIVVAIHAGGVLKTHTACNLAGLAAANGMRTLLVDLDPQAAGCSLPLGSPIDDGTRITRCLVDGEPPHVVRSVGGREGLDLIPSGPKLRRAIVLSRNELAPTVWLGSRIEEMVRVVSDPEHPYDLVVFDTPPGDPEITRACMTIAPTVVIPSGTTLKNVVAIGELRGLVNEVKDVNPDLWIAGVVITDVDGEDMRRQVVEMIEELVGADIPIFDGWIKHMKKAGTEGEKHGLLAHEILQLHLDKAAGNLTREMRGEKSDDNYDFSVKNPGKIAHAYNSILNQLVTEMKKRYVNAKAGT